MTEQADRESDEQARRDTTGVPPESLAPAQQGRAKQPTEYVVLRACEGPGEFGCWERVDTVTASSARAAVAAATRNPDPADGEYKAIPVRSWRTFRVSEKQRDPVRTVEEVQD